MRIHFKGGDTADVSNYEPEQLPVIEDEDIVVFDQCTTDVLCNSIPNWWGLDMTNFKNKIYYQFSSEGKSGVFHNHEKNEIFICLANESIRNIG